MSPAEFTSATGLPLAGARIPAGSVRAALATVGILLTLIVYRTTGWLALGVAFSLLAAWAPKYLLSWVLIVFLAIGELGRAADLTWQLLVLVAGVHLLHLLGMLALGLPRRSLIEPRVFKRPLQRFIATQIPAQGLAAVALLLLAPDTHGRRPLTLPAVALVGAFALVALALLLLRRRTGIRV